MSKELYSNAAISFIGATPVGATDATIILTDSSMFPATGNFTVKCGDEIMLVTANNTTTKTLTVTRAQEGTTGVTHATGAPLWASLTDGSLRRLVIASNAGTVVGARRQLNFIQGANTTLTMTDDPTNDKVDITIAGQAGGGGGGGGFEATPTKPLIGAFTQVNSPVVTTTTYGLSILDVAHNSMNRRILQSTTAVPAVPWKVEARLTYIGMDQASANDFGIFVATSDLASWETMSLTNTGGNNLYGTAGLATGAQSGGAARVLNGVAYGQPWWVRICQHDGNRYFQVSHDGLSWFNNGFYHDYLGPASSWTAAVCGIYVNANNNWGADMMVGCQHFAVGAYT